MFRTALSLALIVLACCQFAQAGDASDHKKLNAVSAEIRKTESALKKNASKSEQLSHQLRKAEIERGQISKKISELENQLASYRRELKSLEKEQRELEASQQKQQVLIRQQINTANRLGREEPVKLLLNQEDPEQLTRSLKYYNYFLNARAKKLDEYITTLNRLSQLSTDIDQKTALLNQRRNRLQDQQEKLESSRRQRSKLLAELKQQRATDKQKLDKLQRERNRLKEVINAIDKAIANIPLPETAQPFKRYRGKMPPPVKGKVRQRFGSQRNAKMKWLGWVFDAREGEQVRTIHSGRVVFSDYLRGYGLMVIVDHGDGYMSLYAHNQVLLKDTGDWVATGDPVAQAGNSGGLEESGLYFEIRHNGKPTNPKPWLASR